MVTRTGELKYKRERAKYDHHGEDDMGKNPLRHVFQLTRGVVDISGLASAMSVFVFMIILEHLFLSHGRWPHITSIFKTTIRTSMEFADDVIG